VKTRKWTILALSGGLLLSLKSCAADVGYYLLETLSGYLPDILEALTNTTTST